MNLWDMLSHCKYSQEFDVYVGNAYNQYIPIGEGDADSLRSEGDEFFYHLMDEVEHFDAYPDGAVVVIVKDRNYNRPAEELYRESYTKRWDRFDPKTRPWRDLHEIMVKHKKASGTTSMAREGIMYAGTKKPLR